MFKIKRRGIFMQLRSEIRGSWFLILLRSENIFILNMILFLKKRQQVLTPASAPVCFRCFCPPGRSPGGLC